MVDDSFFICQLQMWLFCNTLPLRPASLNCLFTVEDDISWFSIWHVLFKEAANCGTERIRFLTTDSDALILLNSYASGPSTSFQFWLDPVCISVWNLQFLGNLTHGITFISQNNNSLTCFLRNLFCLGNFWIQNWTLGMSVAWNQVKTIYVLIWTE